MGGAATHTDSIAGLVSPLVACARHAAPYTPPTVLPAPGPPAVLPAGGPPGVSPTDRPLPTVLPVPGPPAVLPVGAEGGRSTEAQLGGPGPCAGRLLSSPYQQMVGSPARQGGVRGVRGGFSPLRGLPGEGRLRAHSASSLDALRMSQNYVDFADESQPGPLLPSGAMCIFVTRDTSPH